MRREPFQAALKPVQQQLGSVGNMPESPKAARSNPLADLANHVKNMFTGASNAGATHRQISAPTDLRTAPIAALTRSDQVDMVGVALDKLAKVSDAVTPLLHRSAHSGVQHADFSQGLRDLASAVNALAKVVPETGGPSDQLDVSADVLHQIKALAGSPLANGTTLGTLLTTAARRESVFNHPGTRQQLVQFTDEVKQIARVFARATGDADNVALANALFPDPAPLEAHLERVNVELEANGAHLSAKDGLRLEGVRHRDVPYRADNAFQLSNGKAYNAHRMVLPDGAAIGIGTSYPRPGHMPNFLRMLDESGATNVVVLASAKEIDDASKGLPAYFRENNTWGEYDVHVEQGRATKYGRFSVDHYALTITRPDGSTFERHVEHFRNWPDKSTVPHEALLAYAGDRQARGFTSENTIAHCSAGVGRTGLFFLANALAENPNLTAAEVGEAMRRERSPLMLQTPDQRETALKVQRALADKLGAAFGAEPLYDFQRQSYFNPSAPADGEPLYQNLPLHPQPLYENVGPFRR